VAASSQTDVWAVGYQSDPGPALFQPLVEHWDGSSWSITPVPWPPRPSTINILHGVTAVSSDDAWAVGSSTAVRHQALAYHWDGAAWTRVLLDLPAMNALYSVIGISSNDVWAVGRHDPDFTDYLPLSLHWNGFRWRTVPAANPNENANLHDVAAISSRDLWAVGGTFPGEGGGLSPLTEHFDGCGT
jgi:hypothetical protein